jgi:uncharacterized protein (DUF1330 family)
MNRYITVGLAMLAGAAIGAAAVQSIHAQAKPPVYQIAEIEPSDAGAYLKNYAPRAQAAIKAAVGRFLAASGKTTPIEGDPPKARIALIVWDTAEQALAYRQSAAFKDLQPLRDKSAKFRQFLVEGASN